MPLLDSGMICRRLFFPPMLSVMNGGTEQAAFFGSHWKCNSDPELSEAERFMTQAGGSVTMILSVAQFFFSDSIGLAPLRS